MIDETMTIELFGLPSTSLSAGSGQKVVRVCDVCGAISNVHMQSYVRQMYPDLCRSCSQKQMYIDEPDRRDQRSIDMKSAHKEHPEYGKDITKRMLGHTTSDDTRIKLSIAATKRGISPDTREKMRQGRIRYLNSPSGREQQSRCLKQYHEYHPEAREQIALRAKEHWAIKENRERMSASKLGEDYDAGEWTGFTDKSRPHIVPVNACVQMNARFDGSEFHHITQSLGAFIPAELHKHIYHNLTTGQNMGEMNMLTLQYINRGV